MTDTDSINNCAICDHKRYADGGHCYMFKTEPVVVCMHHTFIQALVRPTVPNVFQAAILDNAEIVHRGRYVEL